MIRWILFDQAKVQTHNIFSRKEFYSIGDRKFSSRKLELVFDLPEYNEFSLGKITEDELINTFLDKYELDLSIDEFIILLQEAIEPIEGMKELLEQLSKKYELATLINEGSEWAKYKLEVPHFDKFFKVNIISGEIGLEKPDKEFYLKALEILNAKPEECIFTDDKKENCDAAETVGIKSIVFTNAAQLKQDLQKYNVYLD